ncbi:uncharacterized protein LOC136072363 [Hydra vulgaris]|uniref:uncharacterized protein LOC136072363 n=1 Tax=Hydra vulgaris TaxID=6087 RepID=UPI0032EA8CFE
MLEEDVKKIYNGYLKFPKKMMFTIKDKNNFDNAKICHICENELGEDRVRDHCHITGKYRSAAHSYCNLQFKIPKFIPVFHNLSNYDSHLFIKKLSGVGKSEGGKSEGGKLNCIPNNEEKYISFSKELKVNEFTNKEGKKVEVKLQLRFHDSFRFMAASLNSLTKNLSKDQCKNISIYYSGNELNLLLRKGVYPYEWVDSIDKLNETQLPPKESFYSRFNDEEISDEDYLHAQNVWKEFKCETFRDILYNESDVLLLADVFENFRDQGIRGGISMVPNRLGTAKSKYMKNYDESKESTYIQYLDANSLYGWAMNKPLPTHGFKWMNEEELKNWKSISCILEVDLEYPEHLHDLHNDYPLAPERLKIDKVEKLVTNLNHKKNYIIHYENLKLYERFGMKLTKIHRVIKFKESAWLSKYVNLNTDLRTKATNDFEKDFFKLMNNSVFGKTMENIENRVDVRLVTKREEAIKLASKPKNESRTMFDENLIAIHMKRTKLVYNKPIYLGMCI